MLKILKTFRGSTFVFFLKKNNGFQKNGTRASRLVHHLNELNRGIYYVPRFYFILLYLTIFNQIAKTVRVQTNT